jgi:Terpene synthase family 2, C-terminal metal binding
MHLDEPAEHDASRETGANRMPPAVAPAIGLLPFHCPFPAAEHPERGEIERHCVAWIDRFELYGDAAQRERLIGTRAAEIYARALPTADPERVADVAKWLYWGFATDDLYYDNGPTSRRAAEFLALAAPLVRLSEEPRASFRWELPYDAALRDLTYAILRHATPAQRIEWVHTARAWFFGMAWDVANAERGVPPSLNDYLAMRMHTGGLASWATTLNIANAIELTPAQAASGPVRALVEAWSTFCLLLNDLMSFAKEAHNADSSSNLVAVLAHERACAACEALPEAHALCDRIATLFLALHGQLLARAHADGDAPMAQFLASLGHTWRGILDWGFRAPRYVTGGDPGAPPLQTFPGWAQEPLDASLAPLPYPSIAWWWEELT